MAQAIGRYFNPVLSALRKLGGSGRPSEVCAMVAEQMNLTDSVLEETLDSGQSRFENKVAFVRLYLVLTGYIDRSRRGVWTLTEKGRNTDHLSDKEIQALLLDVQRKGKRSSGENPDLISKLSDADETEEEEVSWFSVKWKRQLAG
jgi:restriction system protein